MLVADLRDGRLLALDWNRGRISAIGRSGSGPLECRGVGFVHALGGDSTLFTDAIARHWFILKDTRIVRRISATTATVDLFGPALSGASATDRVLGVAGFPARSASARAVRPRIPCT